MVLIVEKYQTDVVYVCVCVRGWARTSPWNRTAARESPLSLEDEREDVLLAAEDPVACALGSRPRCNQNQKMLEGWTALCHDHMLLGLLKAQ